MRGLLGSVVRKNSWQLAQHVGAATPHGFQRLLGRASWDADTLRDEVRRYATEHLLSDNEAGVLIVDETEFLKKGNKSAGVHANIQAPPVGSRTVRSVCFWRGSARVAER